MSFLDVPFEVAVLQGRGVLWEQAEQFHCSPFFQVLPGWAMHFVVWGVFLPNLVESFTYSAFLFAPQRNKGRNILAAKPGF